MERIQLSAMPREVIGKQVKHLRDANLIPGVIYGHGFEPLPVQFAARDLELVLQRAGTSTLLNIEVAGTSQPYTVIVRDVQRHPLKRYVTHVDMQALNMAETVRVAIPVVLSGDSPAVRDLHGMLLHLITEVEVEGLPSALIPAIEVNVSGLTELGAALTVGALAIPEGLKILTPAEEIVVQVSMPEEEEEEEVKAAVEPAAPAEVEVVRKRKAEEVEE
ncbi:MAG TPA: 50S ribosomal protein L25 [Anaerolineae bacterium]|nr:MAG: General stress protein CTC [Chloroflexi bacterium ADurb.Bin222]HOC21228.1 50S ribosomal protein L25 [Anaerolineae bacterium]HOS80155.1 50S ribosomal protein L25 [Anaerolineae bacterium]HQE98307.1 50S ribosomal protein L25 [Anaerolineae bacterium]HQJ11747.1 50S ribosomal protein L25 [Anaerolineae bacterium]